MIEIAIALLLIAAFFYIGKRRLSDLRQSTEQPFREFEAQAKIRRDLLNNLVETDLELGRGYEIVISKIEDLSKANTGNKIPFNSWIENENQLTSALAELLPILNTIPYSEIPDKVVAIQKKLRNSSTGFIQAAEKYNAAIENYNNAVIMFPSNAYALIFNYGLRKPVIIPTISL